MTGNTRFNSAAGMWTESTATPPSSSFGSIPEAHGTFAQSVNAESPAKARQVGGDHYAKQAIQPWDIFDTWPLAERIGFYRGSVLKYLLRAGAKGPALEDYAKAQHCLEKLIEVVSHAKVS